MSDFRQLSDTVFASPQVTEADIVEAKALGVTIIVNNRPDDEEAGQPTGASIENAARANGMNYQAIPITHSGFSEPQVETMATLLDQAEGKVLAYCRSGTRSTFLWALAKASVGDDVEQTAAAAAQAGYDISPVRPAMDMLAAKARD